HNVGPGKTSVRAFLRAGGQIYVVNPKDTNVDVAPDAPAMVTVPVHALFITGTVTQNGKLFPGHQMNIFPSVPPAPPSRDNFGFAVPFKDGRFAFHEDDTTHDVHIEIPSSR
ncbi:MAG TPA: hypothetical protein VG323_07650, partial [Thermoanaerobaculia bacterium]|nr:hypothetical protein [Thermoanaerobaculia bacterium]